MYFSIYDTVFHIDYTEQELVKETSSKIRYDIFTSLFGKISGNELSNNERRLKKLTAPEFTYGEIEILYFLPLLKLASKSEGGVFWDLGSGTGKAMIAAALGYNNFSKICGVELLEGLFKTSQKMIESYKEIAISKKFEISKEKLDNLFYLVQADMTKIDWSNADLIYAASICFPDELIKALIEKGKMLKKGTRIITLKQWIDPAHYKVVYNLRVKMTWGRNGLYIIEKI